MFLKIIVLKKFVNFTKKTCVGVFFNKVAGPQNFNFIKRDSNKDSRSPVAASASLRFPACNFVKKENPAKMFFCELYRIFKNIF